MERKVSGIYGPMEYYQQLLLHSPFRREDELLSDSNVSNTYKEECYLRNNIIKQEEDALSSLEDAAKEILVWTTSIDW